MDDVKKNTGFLRLSFFLIFFGFLVFSSVQNGRAVQISSRLLYDRQNSGAAPIPPSEKSLQTVLATSYYQVTKENHFLSGGVFDDKGNLFFCDWTERKIFRLTAARRLSLVGELKDFNPSALSFGGDGRLYVAAYAQERGEGAVFAIKPEGGAFETIIAPDKGFMPKNLFFSRSKGFYFTDYKGTPTEGTGGVYYVSPDFKTISKVVGHLSLPNGLMVSPDQKILWVIETGTNALHRILLKDTLTPQGDGWNIPYYFTGPSPESLSGGSDGNIYVALKGQGRVLILNNNGLPIGQILVNGRAKGHNLLTSTIVIKPDSKALYILSSDGDKGWGAGIFSQTSFGHGVNFQNFESDE